MSVRLDGQWLLPATSPHANRLLPLGHGLSRLEASIVPALPGLLAAGRAATFPKEARRANGRGNSVTAGRRHECPRPAQGSPGCPGTAGVPRSRPEPRVPAGGARGRSGPALPPRWPRAGRSEAASPGQVSHRPPHGGSRCARRCRGAACAGGRTDGRTD